VLEQYTCVRGGVGADVSIRGCLITCICPKVIRLHVVALRRRNRAISAVTSRTRNRVSECLSTRTDRDTKVLVRFDNLCKMYANICTRVNGNSFPRQQFFSLQLCFNECQTFIDTGTIQLFMFTIRRDSDLIK